MQRAGSQRTARAAKRSPGFPKTRCGTRSPMCRVSILGCSPLALVDVCVGKRVDGCSVFGLCGGGLSEPKLMQHPSHGQRGRKVELGEVLDGATRTALLVLLRL